VNTALTLLPDFSLILLGVALRRWMHLGDHFWSGVEKLVYFVLFPALLFNALTRTPLQAATALPLVATGAAAMLGAMVLAYVARWLFPMTPMSFASQFQCAFRYNTYIGIAIAGKLHGAAGIAAMGLMAGGLVPLANVAAVGMLARHSDAHFLRELVRNPLVMATVGGLLWNFAGLPVPGPAGQVLGRLADAAVALGLLAVGSALKLRGPTEGGMGGAAYLLAIKLVAMPAIAWSVAVALGLSGIYFDVALVFAALPTASSAYILAARMGGDAPRVAWLISASTLLAMITLPVWLVLR
jgi:malonate transporter and related proteins